MSVSFKDLMAKGYFPKELPDVFTTESYADYLQNLKAASVVIPSPANSNKITRTASHNLARSFGYRRSLHIPHPYNHYLLCEKISSNWSTLDTHYAISRLSLSRPITDPSRTRAMRTLVEFGDLPKYRARIRANSFYILRTDITRFYGSIYTHSIPWALVGKSVAKVQRHTGLGNELDLIVRNAQDQQTLGIPVGPDTSLIIAEIVACAVDQEIQKNISDLNGFRFMDDYEFGFTNRSDAEKGLSQIEEALNQYELSTSPHKTLIEELPLSLESPWSIELKGRIVPDMEVDNIHWLIEYFSKAFELKKSFPDGSVLTYAINQLHKVDILEEIWLYYQRLLFQSVLVEPSAMSAAVSHLYKYPSLLNKSEFDRWIETIIVRHNSMTHGSEVAWALWSAILFRRPIDTRIAKMLDGSPDSFVALLTLHARDLRLIKRNVQFPKWESKMVRTELYDRSWLLAYEAEIKGWLPVSTPSHVDQDPFFSQLKKAKVSFYDTSRLSTSTAKAGGISY